MENITNIKCQFVNNEIDIFLTPNQFAKINNGNSIKKLNFRITSDKTNNVNKEFTFKELNKKINRLTKTLNKLKKKINI